MTIKQYIIIMTVATVMGWVSWGLILFLVAPQDAGNIGFFLFYISLFLALLGTFAIIGLALRSWRTHKKNLVIERAIDAFRQALWFAIVVVASLILQGAALLTWWNIMLMVLIIALLEFFFISAVRGRDHRKYI